MKRLLILLTLFCFIHTFAQVKFGKVTEEELMATASSFEPEAAAEIISKKANYNVMYNAVAENFETLKEVEVRIKIYNKNKTPSRLLNIEIPAYYLDKNKKEKISGVRAYTYNLEDGKVVESKVNSSDIFTEKKHDYLEVDKFAFPNVKDGSIVEYKYTISTPRFFDLDTWYFQAEVPVLYNRLNFEYPEIFIYQQDRRGDVNTKIETKLKNTTFNFKNKVDILEMTNIPSLQEEPFIQNTDNLRTSIRYELVVYFFPGYGYKNFAMTWEGIVKDLYRSSEYGGELKGNNMLETEVQGFSAISNPIEKMAAIFSFVQNKYSWNGLTGLYPEKGVRKTFNEKSGNGTDLNFILINMLQKAGITSYPVVLSTVDNGMLNFFPSKQKLNHTLTAAVIDNQIYLMDPIEKLSKINMLPTQDLNFQGFMIMEDGKYQQLDLVNRLTSEIKNSITYEVEDDVLKGNFFQTKNNYYAMNDLRRKSRNETGFQSGYLSRFDLDATDFKFQQNANGDAVRYQVEFQDEKSLESIGNKLFIKPLLFLATESNEFKFSNEERKYPLEFGTPFTQISITKLKIPEGYKLEKMPENLNFLLQQNAGGFDIKFEEENGFITVTSLLHVGHSMLPQKFYGEVRNMFQNIIEKENEQIILVKQ